MKRTAIPRSERFAARLASPRAEVRAQAQAALDNLRIEDARRMLDTELSAIERSDSPGHRRPSLAYIFVKIATFAPVLVRTFITMPRSPLYYVIALGGVAILIPMDIYRAKGKYGRIRALTLELLDRTGNMWLDRLIRLWEPQSRLFPRPPDTRVLNALAAKVEAHLMAPEQNGLSHHSMQTLRAGILLHFGRKDRFLALLPGSRHDLSEPEADLLATLCKLLARAHGAENRVLLERIARTSAHQPNRRFVQEVAMVFTGDMPVPATASTAGHSTPTTTTQPAKPNLLYSRYSP